MVLAPGAVGLKLWRPADQILSGAAADATALLHLDGANGSTSIVDSSGNGYVFTASGAAVLDTSQSKFGSASFKPNVGSLVGPGAALNFGTGDFTVDIQFRANGTPSNDVDLIRFGSASSYTAVFIDTFGSGNIIVLDGGATVITGTVPPASVWVHLALTRASGVTRLFLDGVQQGANWSDSKNYSNNSNEPSFSVGSSRLNGWYDEIRVVVGTGVWTSNFTPPTASYLSAPTKMLAAAGAYTLTGIAAALTYVSATPAATALLHFDGTNGSTTIVDSSGNNFTFAVAGAAALDTSTAVFGPSSLHCTGGSVQGTGASGLNFGTGDYTIDFRFTNAAASTGWDAATAGPNLVVTSTTVDGSGVGGPSSSVRTTTSHSTGKYYVEMTHTVYNFKFGFGIANASLPNTGDLGNDNYPSNGAAIFVNGNFYANTTGISVFSSGFVANDKIDMALNLTNMLVWYRVNNGAWNPSLGGTQDPTATPGTGGGIDLTNQNGGPIAAGPYYLAFSTWLDSCAARFSSSSWVNTAPSGYGEF